MDYYRARPTARSASVGSSDSQDLKSRTTLVITRRTTDVYLRTFWSFLPPPTPAVPHPGICSIRPTFSEQLRQMPRDGSTNSSLDAVPGTGVDVAQGDWECVCSVRQSPANTDDYSECSIEKWDHTSHDTMPPDYDDETGEALTLDVDALHARRWDLISPLEFPRDALFLRMHGRPLEQRRLPPERQHGSARRRAPLPPVPHPRIRLPLLSAFASLLSIDDATLHLITHSRTHSALFPGPIWPPYEGPEEAQETRGNHALLEPSSRLTLRDGLAVACDESILPSNPFKLFASPLVGLVDLVRGIWTGVERPCAKFTDKRGRSD